MNTLFSSLRARLGLLVLIAVLPGLALLLYNNLEQRQLAAEQARQEALRLVRVAADNQEESVEGTRQLLITLAQLPEVHAAEQRACSVLLGRIRNQNLRYANLGAIDLDGNVFCSALPRSGPVYVGDRTYFQEALTKRDFTSGEYQIGRITGRPGINFAYPVFDDDGDVQAVVFAALDLAWLNELAAGQNLDEGTVLFTADRQGTILTRYPDGDQWIGRSLPEAPIVETILARQGVGTAEMEGLDGVFRLYAFTPLSDNSGIGVYVGAGIPTATAYAAADRLLIRNLIGISTLTLLFLAVAWTFADLFILRRVRALAQAARRLAGDDLGARTGLPHSAGELGQLARTFDEMAATLERRLRRLQALNAIDRAITAHYELPRTLDVVLEQVMTQLDIDAAAILLLDHASGFLEYAAGRGFHSEAIRASRLKLGEGYSGRVALERRALFIRDLENASGFVQVSLIEGEEFVSYCGVPLVAKAEIQGVLSVFSRTALDFEGEWVAFLEALALQAAIAIDNSRLLSETHRLLGKTQEQARQVRQIVDTMPEGVWLLDTRQQVILTNSLGQSYLSQLAGTAADDIVTTLGNQPLETFLEPVCVDQPWHELTLPQEEQIFEIASQPVRDNGHVDGWVLVLREVTEERQRQEYMQTHDRLATLGQVAAGIAHDFNNIMAVIVLYTQALARNPDHPQREKYLTTIGDQAHQAAELIGQILDFSRASTMERSCLDLSPFVKEVTRILQRLMPSNIAVSLDVGADEYTVEADATRLQQVLMNLAVNARDAMSEGGRLHIALSRLSLESGMPAPLPDLEPGQYTCLFVSDTGPGIPRDVLPHIFEPFFTTKPRGRGTGLGLAQVYGLVRQHGGAIDVESELGKGTTFVIYLPAPASQSAEQDAKITSTDTVRG